MTRSGGETAVSELSQTSTRTVRVGSLKLQSTDTSTSRGWILQGKRRRGLEACHDLLMWPRFFRGSSFMHCPGNNNVVVVALIPCASINIGEDHLVYVAVDVSLVGGHSLLQLWY
eukprot:CAMPEP_0178743244 /NCGR_PEP_ID=MMETSP0744-20121128/6101_1 /TAXON_ID=913974 /ORGANISM="Nitzschia punctata, Strain CCMP561" /LENGTH=114 /DNA_ID=CAMNT_0020396233 /DNA_START=312 /DNA_END=657 /DNA_ORIENTATION=-